MRPSSSSSRGRGGPQAPDHGEAVLIPVEAKVTGLLADGHLRDGLLRAWRHVQTRAQRRWDQPTRPTGSGEMSDYGRAKCPILGQKQAIMARATGHPGRHPWRADACGPCSPSCQTEPPLLEGLPRRRPLMNRHREGIDPTQLSSSTEPDLRVLAEVRRSLTWKNAPLWRVLSAAVCGTLTPRDPPRQGSR
jgi:hypothetical protein